MSQPNLYSRVRKQRPKWGWGLAVFVIGLGIQIGGASNYKIARGLFVVAALLLFWDVTSRLRDFKNPEHRLLGLVATAITLILGAWAAWKYLAPAPPPPTFVIVSPTVSPSSVTFGNIGELYTFTVANRTDRDWYSIIVDIRLHAKTASMAHFQIDADHQMIYPETPDYGAIYDPIIVTNTENSTQFPGWWCLIYRMKAHDSRDIRVRRLKSDENEAVPVFALVTHSELEAQPLVPDDNGEVKFRFDRYWYGVRIVKDKPKAVK